MRYGQNGGCGDARYFSCTNVAGGPPDCADIDECASGNGGCANELPTCLNQIGAPPTCIGPLPCAPPEPSLDEVGAFTTCFCDAVGFCITEPPFGAGEIRGLWADGDTLWVVAADRLFRREGDTWETVVWSEPDPVRAVAGEPGGPAWVLRENSLIKIEATTNLFDFEVVADMLPSTIPEFRLPVLAVGEGEVFLLGSFGLRKFDVSAQAFQSLGVSLVDADGASVNLPIIVQIERARDGQILVMGYPSSADRPFVASWSSSGWTFVHQLREQEGAWPSNISALSDDEFWTSNGGELLHVKAGEVTSSGVRGMAYEIGDPHVYASVDGRVFVSSDRGTFVRTGEEDWKQIFSDPVFTWSSSASGRVFFAGGRNRFANIDAPFSEGGTSERRFVGAVLGEVVNNNAWEIINDAIFATPIRVGSSVYGLRDRAQGIYLSDPYAKSLVEWREGSFQGYPEEAMRPRAIVAEGARVWSANHRGRVTSLLRASGVVEHFQTTSLRDLTAIDVRAGVVAAAANSGQVVISRDSGASWSTVFSDSSLWLKAIKIGPDGRVWVVGSRDLNLSSHPKVLVQIDPAEDNKVLVFPIDSDISQLAVDATGVWLAPPYRFGSSTALLKFEDGVARKIEIPQSDGTINLVSDEGTAWMTVGLSLFEISDGEAELILEIEKLSASSAAALVAGPSGELDLLLNNGTNSSALFKRIGAEQWVFVREFPRLPYSRLEVDDDGHFWTASAGDVLLEYDPATDTWTRHTLSAAPSSAKIGPAVNGDLLLSGRAGAVFRFDGERAREVGLPSTVDVVGAFAFANGAWAVTKKEVFARSGGAWTERSTSLDDTCTIVDAAAPSASFVIVVARCDDIHRVQRVPVQSPATTLTSSAVRQRLAVAGANNVWILEPGNVRDSETWQSQTNGLADRGARAVEYLSADNVWVLNSELHHWDGARWWTFPLSFKSPRHLVAKADGGLLLTDDLGVMFELSAASIQAFKLQAE